MKITLTALYALLGGPLLVAQNGVIAGTVVDSHTGGTLRKATVELRVHPPRSDDRLTAHTDDEGAFHFRDVPPGRYAIQGGKPGYVRSGYRSRGSGGRGTVLDLSEGETIDDLVLRLTPGGVVTGRVVDDFLDPMPEVGVQALENSYGSGSRQLVPVRHALTDDRGQFRLWGLKPGRYFLRAEGGDQHVGNNTPGQDGVKSLIPTFFPSAAEASQALPVEVQAGAETAGVEIRMLLDRSFRVSGLVVDAETQQPVGPAAMTLEPLGGLGLIGAGSAGRGDSSGRFTFRGVRPGSYRIHSLFGRQSSDFRTGSTEVVVADRDVGGVVIEVSRGVEISGKVEVENGAPRPEGKVSVRLRGESSTLRVGASDRVEADGTFTLRNVPPGAQSIEVAGELSDYFLKAARFGERLLDDGKIAVSRGEQPQLELLLSPQAGRIAGLITDDRGEAIPGATVALLREDRDERFIRSARTDQNGAYLFRGIAPGRYELFAWKEVEPGAWASSEFLEPFEGKAEKVEVRESDALEVSLEALDSSDR